MATYGRTCLAVVGDGDRALGQAERSLFELRKVLCVPYIIGQCVLSTVSYVYT